MWFVQKVKRPLVLSYSSRRSTCEWTRFLSKSLNTWFLGNFWDYLGPPDLTRLFSKVWQSLFLLYDYLTSCKNSQKTNELILRFTLWRDRQLDKQTTNKAKHTTLPVAWVSKSKLISIISFPVQVSDKMYAIVDMLLLRYLKRFPDNFPFLEISKSFPDNFLFLKSQPFYSPFNLV